MRTRSEIALLGVERVRPAQPGRLHRAHVVAEQLQHAAFVRVDDEEAARRRKQSEQISSASVIDRSPTESPNALSNERVDQEPDSDEHHEQDRQARKGSGRAFANHVTDLLKAMSK